MSASVHVDTDDVQDEEKEKEWVANRRSPGMHDKTRSSGNNSNSAQAVNKDDEENGRRVASAENAILGTAAAWRGVKRSRQYKKDTIYLYDLYTLTYDNNEQLESIGMFNTIENENVRIATGCEVQKRT